VTFLVHKDVTFCSVCDEIWHLRGALRQLLYGDITYGTYPYNLCNYFLYEIPGQQKEQLIYLSRSLQYVIFSVFLLSLVS